MFRRYMAGQEAAENAPEAKQVEVGSSEGYSIGGEGVQEAQSVKSSVEAGSHKRLDVSDEIEADEIIEEPSVDGNEKVSMKGGSGDVKVLYCTS